MTTIDCKNKKDHILCVTVPARCSDGERDAA